jgi:hypothetical protein
MRIGDNDITGGRIKEHLIAGEFLQLKLALASSRDLVVPVRRFPKNFLSLVLPELVIPAILCLVKLRA